jgi:haloacid dehalogenase-like hydrolase
MVSALHFNEQPSHPGARAIQRARKQILFRVQCQETRSVTNDTCRRSRSTISHLAKRLRTDAFDAGVTEDEVAYMGDDLPDIPLARRAGLAVCVADGAPELAAICHFTTRRLAGRGTAREVVELILKAQGRWEEAVPKALA